MAGRRRDYVMPRREAEAEMALNEVARMRDRARAAGMDPDSYMAGFYAITGAPMMGLSPEVAQNLLAGGGAEGAISPNPFLDRIARQGTQHLAGPARIARNAGIGFIEDYGVKEYGPGPDHGADGSNVERTVLGLNSTGIVAAGASVTITTQAQTIFKPQRLIVAPSLADFFTVDQFNVGVAPLFAAAGSVPASAFSGDSEISANVRGATAQPGINIVLQVTNIDGAGHPFRSALFGLSLPLTCGPT